MTTIGWLVGCLGFNGPLRHYFSLYRAVSQREGERGEKRIDESKNVQTTPTRTYYKRSRPLPYCHPNCRTPRHWKLRNNKDKIRKCLNGNNYASIWWTALSLIICTTTHHCLNIDQDLVSALFDENKNQVMSRNLYRVITFLKFGVL